MEGNQNLIWINPETSLCEAYFIRYAPKCQLGGGGGGGGGGGVTFPYI